MSTSVFVLMYDTASPIFLKKNSADRDKVSNLDGKLCQKTVAVSSVRPLKKFIELSANFLLIVFPNVIQVKDVFLNPEQ